MKTLRKQALQSFKGPGNKPFPADPKVPLPGENDTHTWPDKFIGDDEASMEEPTFIYDEGRFISHKELMMRFNEWKRASPGSA
jgi:hypothetical protein